MADINNIDEYRASVLSALGIEDDVNIRYFEDFRRAILTKLGMEFTTEDLRNEERFRLKFLEGVSAFSGLSVKTVSGAIVSFNDAVYDVPLKTLLVNFGYKASGYNAVNVTRCGKNILKPNINSGLIGINVGSDDTTVTASTRYGYTDPIDGSQSLTLSYRSTDLNKLDSIWVLRYRNGIVTEKLFSATLPSNFAYKTFAGVEGTYIRAVYGSKSGYAVGDTPSGELQIELGSTATAYEPYQGDTYPISLGQTVYGGTLEVMSGKLISTLASDGTELLVPLEIQLPESQVQIIRSLSDHNNIWADIGGVEVKYLAK